MGRADGEAKRAAAGAEKAGERKESSKGGRHREHGRRSPAAGVPTPSRGHRMPGGGSAGGPSTAAGITDSAPMAVFWLQGSTLEDLMRRKGVDEAWSTLEKMQSQGVSTDKFTVSRMLMKTVGDGRGKSNPQRIYRGISLVEKFIEAQPKDVDEVLFNALLDTCCRMKDLTRLEATVQRMRQLNITPSPVTLGILVKTYGQAGDLPKVLQVWTEMEKQRGLANDVTYGCMLDACVKCGSMEKALEIFQGMREQGKHKNTVLYTTLIKGFGMEKDLPKAFEIFREMAKEGVAYNTITYNSILDACVKCNDLPAAEAVLREMLASHVVDPDLITFSTMLKGYCHNADLDKALQVIETIKGRGLRCDELVYNTLMDGCVRANDMAAGIGLFEEMVGSGLKPSSHTHSILVRLYQRQGYEDAMDAVAQLYQHHGLERPPVDMQQSLSSGRGGRGRGGGGRSSGGGSPASSGGGHMSAAGEGGWASQGAQPCCLADALQQGVGPATGLPLNAAQQVAFGGHPWTPGPSPLSSPMWSPASSPMEGFSLFGSPHALGQQPLHPFCGPMPQSQMFAPGVVSNIPPFPLSGNTQPSATMPGMAGPVVQQGVIPAGYATGQGDMMFFVPMVVGTGHGSGPASTCTDSAQLAQLPSAPQQLPVTQPGPFFAPFGSGQFGVF